MKKIFIIVITTVLIFSGFMIVANADSDQNKNKTKEQSFVISEPYIKDSEGYFTINFEESTSYILDSGKPMLPVFSKVFILPFGSKLKNVEVIFSNENEILLSKEIKPAPEIISLSETLKNIENPTKNEDIYSSSEIYPPNSFSYNTGSGLQDKEHVIFVSVRCYPIRYSPSMNKLIYNKNINIKIEYNEPINPLKYPDEYDLVIITPSIFIDPIQRLVEHKNNYDVRTIIKTTEEIYSEYIGYDEAEEIKYFLKDAIENWNAKYALIVGDINLVPIRVTAIEAWNEIGIPTDLYYADIFDSEGQFCSWDSNNNGKFGEYNWQDGMIDDVDLYADINVGRLPCSNKLDVIVTVNKIIDYETRSKDQEWSNKIILMGGDTFPRRGVYEGEVVTEEVGKQLSEFEKIKLWTSAGTFKPFLINKKISDGAGFVDYSGHGYEFGFGTSPPNEEERIEYYTPYLLGMLNSKKYPIFFFDACSTSKLDYKIEGIDFPCFAWFLAKKPVGGAIATIGATRVAFTSVDNEGIHAGAGYLNLHFFKAYEPGSALSEMLTSSQNDYINYVWPDCLTLEEFILIGDPSLKVGGYASIDDSKIIINGDENGINGYPNIPIQLQLEYNLNDQPNAIFWDLNADNIYDDAKGEQIYWTWSLKGTYPISVKIEYADSTIEIQKTVVNIQLKPETLLGLKSGEINEEYTYIINPTKSLISDEIYCIIDWGDKTFSDIIGPLSVNDQHEIKHKWNQKGTYQVRIKTMSLNFEENNFEESGWSDPLNVDITKNKQSKPYVFLFLENLLQRFPILDKLFQYLF